MDKGGLIIDARTVEWHVKGTIPGSKNIPYTQVASRLNELGCKKGAKWDCSNAKTVLLFSQVRNQRMPQKRRQG